MKSKELAVWMMGLGLAGWCGWLPAVLVGWLLACRLICLWLFWHQPDQPGTAWGEEKEKATNPTNPTTESTEQYREKAVNYRV